MKKVFDKNDKFLKPAYLVLLAFIVIIAIGVFICFCRLMYNELYMTGILFLVLGAFGLFVMWIFVCLFFSYLKDIKFIRNKLYGMEERNADLVEKEVESDDKEKK